MMSNTLLATAFSDLSTPLIADACLRAKVPLRVAPFGIRPVVQGMRVAGRVLPARHRGSVDTFLEVMKKALPGDVLVVDNESRGDESCIGDLTVLEAATSTWKVERRQADAIQAGKKLSEQLDFDSYIAKRDSDPSYTLRKHLRERGGAVEE